MKFGFILIIMIISTTIIPEISGQISPWVLEHCSLLSNHDITSGYHIRESFTNQYRDYVQYDSNEECIAETIQNGVSIGNKNFCGFSAENPYYHLTSSQQTAYNYHEYDEEKILVKTHPLDIRIVDRTESGHIIFEGYSESYVLPLWIQNLDSWKVENKINCEEHQKSLKFLFEYYEKFHKENHVENRYYPPEHYFR